MKTITILSIYLLMGYSSFAQNYCDGFHYSFLTAVLSDDESDPNYIEGAIVKYRCFEDAEEADEAADRFLVRMYSSTDVLSYYPLRIYWEPQLMQYYADINNKYCATFNIEEAEQCAKDMLEKWKAVCPTYDIDIEFTNNRNEAQVAIGISYDPAIFGDHIAMAGTFQDIIYARDKVTGEIVRVFVRGSKPALHPKLPSRSSERRI